MLELLDPFASCRPQCQTAQADAGQPNSPSHTGQDCANPQELGIELQGIEVVRRLSGVLGHLLSFGTRM
jgi:hypothetical protein